MSNSILRIYDDSVFQFVKRHVKDAIEGKDLTDRVHMSTPDRPYGFEFPMDGSGNIDTKRADMMLQTPQITITRFDIQYDMSRNQTNPVRVGPYWDADQNYRIWSKYPVPWNLFYQVDIRARLRNDAQAVLNWWLYNPNPTRVLAVDFLYPWGKKGITLKFSQIVDQTIYETEEKLRYMQFVIPFTMEAYMFEAFDHPSDVPPWSNDNAQDAFTTRRRTAKVVKVNFWICDQGKEVPAGEVWIPASPTLQDHRKPPFCQEETHPPIGPTAVNPPL
jgi:hypothetical protein